VIVVTQEIARHPELRRLGRPMSVLPNSIDMNDYPQLPAPQNSQPRLIFIASPRMAWSGVDKVARIATLFPSWDIDVVGPGVDEFIDRPSNLHVHGFLQREEYLPLMARADVAIGPLALHRKGLSEASALKVAEYLAYGIPVIIAHRESAFPDGAPFLLQLANRDDAVEASVPQIQGFVEKWRGQRIARTEIARIDARVVERDRLRLVIAEAPSRVARVVVEQSPEHGPG
jgi:hypothetical protein